MAQVIRRARRRAIAPASGDQYGPQCYAAAQVSERAKDRRVMIAEPNLIWTYYHYSGGHFVRYAKPSWSRWLIPGTDGETAVSKLPRHKP